MAQPPSQAYTDLVKKYNQSMQQRMPSVTTQAGGIQYSDAYKKLIKDYNDNSNLPEPSKAYTEAVKNYETAKPKPSKEYTEQVRQYNLNLPSQQPATDRLDRDERNAAPAPSTNGRDDTREGPGGILQSGTKMTYDSFMRDIGGPQKIEVKDRFAGAPLPGTPGYAGTFPLNTEGKPAETGTKGGRNLPTATVEAAKDGVVATELENQRTLVPGEELSEGAQTAMGYVTNRDSARNRASAAFLSGKDSLDGLRRSEGQMGVISQGAERGMGMKFVRDGSAEGGLRRIDKDQYRRIMDGGDIRQIVDGNPVAVAESGTPEASKPESRNVPGRAFGPGGGFGPPAVEPALEQNPVVNNQGEKAEIIDNVGDAMKNSAQRFKDGIMKDVMNRSR